MIDLIKKTDQETVEKSLDWINNRTNVVKVDPHFYKNGEFSVGDEISFMGGFHADIHYKSKIIGIDTNGWLYLIWDCYWFPIDPADESRNIKNLSLCTQ